MKTLKEQIEGRVKEYIGCVYDCDFERLGGEESLVKTINFTIEDFDVLSVALSATIWFIPSTENHAREGVDEWFSSGIPLDFAKQRKLKLTGTTSVRAWGSFLKAIYKF